MDGTDGTGKEGRPDAIIYIENPKECIFNLLKVLQLQYGPRRRSIQLTVFLYITIKNIISRDAPVMLVVEHLAPVSGRRGVTGSSPTRGSKRLESAGDSLPLRPSHSL